ncbi:hypothetical protein JCM16303_003949 [Sporobolomyces ruberrimus]
MAKDTRRPADIGTRRSTGRTRGRNGQGRVAANVDSGNLQLRPPTSLLSLPDDLLYLVFEELHEQRQSEVATSGPLRIVELLINKRVFAVARPLWFSRLTITTNQLDDRLSGLLGHDKRLQYLRRLELPLTTTFARLTELTLAHTPGLTHFSVICDNTYSQSMDDTLMRSVRSMSLLRYFTASFSTETFSADDTVLRRLMKALPPAAWSRFHEVAGRMRYTAVTGVNRYETYHAETIVEAYDYIPWRHLKYLECGPISLNDRSPVEALLGSLTAAQQDDGNRARRPISLRHLILDLDTWMGWDSSHGMSPHFGTLFRFLASTRLEHLELRSVGWIPQPEPASHCSSVKILRISGACRLKGRVPFAAFHRFLSMFPSLLQLHLVGSNFFQDSALHLADYLTSTTCTIADDMSRLEPMERYFQYPELCTLLHFLRTTRVRIFTYRGDLEKREMRWTRSDEETDFDADCWTL